MGSERANPRQIAVYKTDKRLVELTDKLNPATAEHYAHVLSQGDAGADSKRIYSVIGISISDYSQGTGDKLKNAKANLSPEEIGWIMLHMKDADFKHVTEKIMPDKDENGLSAVTKFGITRTDMRGNEKSKYPWCICIENGKGRAAQGATGGSYCASNTYTAETKVSIFLSDLDCYKLFYDADRYILLYEQAYCIKTIREGREVVEKSEAEYRKQTRR